MSELVERARDGDSAAFRLLYQQHVGRVYAVCLRLSGDRSEAEELTQRVFIRAWEHLGAFRGDSTLATWLHRLAVNEALGERRSLTRRERRVIAVAEPSSHERGTAAADRTGTADLEQAIAALPDGARQVFVLHDVEGYQHDEIAALTGIAPGTSKAQLHRARRLLREALNR